MSKFEKWIIWTVFAPIGAILWLTVGVTLVILYEKVDWLIKVSG